VMEWPRDRDSNPHPRLYYSGALPSGPLPELSYGGHKLRCPDNLAISVAGGPRMGYTLKQNATMLAIPLSYVASGVV
jgi:hypothetical protein